jgi:hypothetical protein
MKYTVEQIMKWKPCYDESKVMDLVGYGLSATSLSALDIPDIDRRWVLIRMLYDVRGKDAVVSFTGNCALRACYHAASAVASAAAVASASASASASAASASAAAAYSATYSAAAADAHIVELHWQIDYLVKEIEEEC